MGGLTFIVRRHDVLLMRSEKPAAGHEGHVVLWPCGDMKRALRLCECCTHPIHGLSGRSRHLRWRRRAGQKRCPKETFYAAHASEGNQILHHERSTSVDTIRGYTSMVKGQARPLTLESARGSLGEAGIRWGCFRREKTIFPLGVEIA